MFVIVFLLGCSNPIRIDVVLRVCTNVKLGFKRSFTTLPVTFENDGNVTCCYTLKLKVVRG